jgi:hypothetical protein
VTTLSPAKPRDTLKRRVNQGFFALNVCHETVGWSRATRLASRLGPVRQILPDRPLAPRGLSA